MGFKTERGSWVACRLPEEARLRWGMVKALKRALGWVFWFGFGEGGKGSACACCLIRFGVEDAEGVE